jgi:hypothetical protein
MILAVANLSAPTGISTLALRLAAERAHLHGSAPGGVLLVTTFPASPSHEAIDRRGSGNGGPEVPTAVLPSARALQMMVPRMAQDYDDIVLDVPGIDAPTVRTALTMADQVVLPVEPVAAEVALGMTSAEGDIREFIMTVDMARHFNPDLLALAVTVGNAEVPSWLEQLLDGQPGWQLSSVIRAGRLGSAAHRGRSTLDRAAADAAVASVA